MWQWASMTRWGCVVAISVLSEGRAGLRDAGLPLLLGRVALRRHERRLVDEPRAGGRVELHDLELEGRRRALGVDLRRGVQRSPAAHVHLQAMRAHRRDVLEEDDPLRALHPSALEALARDLLAALAGDLAVTVAERGVADAVLVADVRELLGDRAHDRDVLLVDRRVVHDRRVDARLRAPPGRDRVLAVHRRHVAARARQTVQVFSWKARSRHAVSAASSTSRGWNGLTPSSRKSSGNP